MEKTDYQFIKAEIAKRINPELTNAEVYCDPDGIEEGVDVYGKPSGGGAIHDVEAVMQVCAYYGLNVYIRNERHNGYLLPTMHVF